MRCTDSPPASAAATLAPPELPTKKSKPLHSKPSTESSNAASAPIWNIALVAPPPGRHRAILDSESARIAEVTRASVLCHAAGKRKPTHQKEQRRGRHTAQNCRQNWHRRRLAVGRGASENDAQRG